MALFVFVFIDVFLGTNGVIYLFPEQLRFKCCNWISFFDHAMDEDAFDMRLRCAKSVYF